MCFHDLLVARGFAALSFMPARASIAGNNARIGRRHIPHPAKRIRLLFAAALAALGLLSAAVPGRAQCTTATGMWTGAWQGKNSAGVPASGPILATFTQMGDTFEGSMILKGQTLNNLEGYFYGSPNLSFTFSNANNPTNTYTIDASGMAAATGPCFVNGTFTVINNAKETQVASGTFFITTALTVTLLDPIPGLASGDGSEFQLSTVPATLSQNGTVVQGAEADGVTQLVVMVGGLQAGQQVTLNVINDQMKPSTSAADDGGLGNLNSGPYAASSLPLNVQQVGNMYMAFAVYQPPADFVRVDQQGPDSGQVQRTVTLQVEDTSGNPLASTTVILMRPPVLTVQGIWEDKTAFSEVITSIKQYGPGGGIPQLVTCEADYNSNTAAMSDAAEAVLAQASLCLLDEKTKNTQGTRIAAGQVDVIAHGSAGLAALEASDWPISESDPTETYGKGYFHKLITLETPYLGSIFAQYYTQNALQPCQNSLAMVGYPNTPMLSAMTPQSYVVTSFLSGLPKTYAKHAIAAELDNVASDSNPNDAFNGTFEETTEIDNYVNVWAPISGCSAVFSTRLTSPPSFNLNVYFTGLANPAAATFNGANDTMSTVWSQLGPLANGLPGGAPDILTNRAYLPSVDSFWGLVGSLATVAPGFPGALQILTVADTDETTWNDLQTLLDQSVGSSFFVY
jgi:hypothetical protein